MSNPPITIDLQPHVRGDRWQGIDYIGPITVNGTTPGGTLARVKMHLRRVGGGGVFRLDSTDSCDRNAPITIVSAENWTAVVPPVDDFVDRAGAWEWDMEFFETGKAAPMTLYKGRLQVNQDVTQ